MIHLNSTRVCIIYIYIYIYIYLKYEVITLYSCIKCTNTRVCDKTVH